jgi:hypothetical protein
MFRAALPTDPLSHRHGGASCSPIARKKQPVIVEGQCVNDQRCRGPSLAFTALCQARGENLYSFARFIARSARSARSLCDFSHF